MGQADELAECAVVVAGDGGAVSAAVAQALAARGAQVIVIAQDAKALLALAQADPARIETLCLRLEDAAACVQTRDIWQATPIAGLVNCLPVESGTDSALSGLEALVAMLGAGLGAGAGLLVTICADRSDPVARAIRAAHLQQAAALRPRLARLGARSATLPVHPRVDLASLGPLLGFLFGPGGALIDGAILPLAPPRARP